MELKELVENFETNWGRMLSPFELEDIQKLVDDDGYSIALVNEALRISCTQGKLFLGYVKGILARMRSRGIRNVKDLEAAEQEKAESENVILTTDFLNAMIAAVELWGNEDSKQAEIDDLQQQKRLLER